MTSVGEDYPKQQERAREVLRQYEETKKLCPQSDCTFAIFTIEKALREADEAAISGDLPLILRAYRELKEIE